MKYIRIHVPKIFLFLSVLVIFLAPFYYFHLAKNQKELCVPSNLKVSDIQRNSVTISWNIKGKQCSSYIKYGFNRKNLDQFAAVQTVQGDTHITQLTHLNAGEKYYFVVVVNNVSYGKEGMPLSFTTLSRF